LALRGLAWSLKGDYTKAIQDYDEAINIRPNDAWVFNDRGVAYYRQQKYDQALADFSEAIRLSPKFEEAYSYRIKTYSRLKDYEKAEADINEVLRLDPTSAKNFNNVAWLLATSPDPKLRNGKRAAELAQKAKDLAKANMWIYYDTLAAAMAETGDFEAAVRWQERALDDPALKDDPGARQRLELYRMKQPYREN
jgi:tetratricopeptide (TPR) repeat protein